ncbi:unnamed protein product [Anisakis simplex]|uniref:DNA replication licensing factor MCM4 n=1 Tax=Anisakis simplex TaxID=6269 RepID=A0A0M3KF29_ANISI|nr:unnamed protein product [Anisakis simplex]
MSSTGSRTPTQPSRQSSQASPQRSGSPSLRPLSSVYNSPVRSQGSRGRSAQPQESERSSVRYESDMETSSRMDGQSSVSMVSSQRMGSHTRPDINTAPAHHRTVRIENADDELMEGEKGAGDVTARLYIWGTRDIIPYLDITANELFQEKYQKVLNTPIEIRPFNAQKTRNLRALNPADMDQLITIHGLVTRTSTLIPEMRQAFFQCSICNNSVEADVDRGRIEEPTSCAHCHHTYTFQLIHNRSLFMDKQIVKLQESPDDMPAGQTPHTLTLFVHGSLVESVQPGDRVAVTGIYRAVPIRINPALRNFNSVYKTNIDVLHFRRTDQSRLHQINDGLSYLFVQCSVLLLECE